MMKIELIGRGIFPTPEACLDCFHKSAASSNLDAYFGCFYSSSSRFLGTDASENWTAIEFLEYACDAFSKPTAWEYIPQPGSRKFVGFGLDDSVITFDEILISTSFKCTSRGTGTLVKNPNGSYLILQYHLSFPTPNHLAKRVCQELQLYEEAVKREMSASEAQVALLQLLDAEEKVQNPKHEKKTKIKKKI
jgi:hypothetical protein